MFMRILWIFVFLKVADGLFGIHIRPAQSVSIRGRLLCMGRPAYDVLLKLYDEDSKFFYNQKNL